MQRTHIFRRGWMVGQFGKTEKRILALQAMIALELGR